MRLSETAFKVHRFWTEKASVHRFWVPRLRGQDECDVDRMRPLAKRCSVIWRPAASCACFDERRERGSERKKVRNKHKQHEVQISVKGRNCSPVLQIPDGYSQPLNRLKRTVEMEKSPSEMCWSVGCCLTYMQRSSQSLHILSRDVWNHILDNTERAGSA